MASPGSSGRGSIVAALTASLVGMMTCQRAFNSTPRRQSVPLHESTLLSALLPFLLGAVAAGGSYYVMTRLLRRHSDAPAEERNDPISDVAASPTKPVNRTSPALAALLGITGAAAAAGALLGALIMSGGDGPNSGYGVTFAEGVLPGGMIGGGLGLLVAVPAAVIIWLIDRKR